jgi:hypothetical protein
MTRTQHDWFGVVSGGRTGLNAALRKKSARLEKSTHSAPSAQFKKVPQLHSTLLKFQRIIEFNESLAAKLLQSVQVRLALIFA